MALLMPASWILTLFMAKSWNCILFMTKSLIFTLFMTESLTADFYFICACPPTRLHAPNVYAPSYARSVPCKRLVSVPPWVGPHPQNPTPRDPPPPTPPGTPPPPTPPHPTPPPPASPSGRLFQVDGYSKWMVIPSAWLFRGVLLQLEIRIQQTRTRSDSVNAETIDCFGGSLYLLSGHNAAPLVRITRSTQEHPRSTHETRSTHEHPGAPQECAPGTQNSPGASRSTPRAPRSTQEHSNPFKPNGPRLFEGQKMMRKFEGPCVAGFCCCTTRLTQTGRGLDRLAQTGSCFAGHPCTPRTPRSFPGAPRSSPGSPQEHPRSTQEHPGAPEPQEHFKQNGSHIFKN